MEQVKDRRTHTRLLCAELMEVIWRDQSGRRRHSVANLEDISVSGISVQIEAPIPVAAFVELVHREISLAGVVRHCRHVEGGYLLGIQLDDRYQWSTGIFRPSHLFDPRNLERKVRLN